MGLWNFVGHIVANFVDRFCHKHGWPLHLGTLGYFRKHFRKPFGNSLQNEAKYRRQRRVRNLWGCEKVFFLEHFWGQIWDPVGGGGWETGSRTPANGNRQQKPEAGNRKPETRSREPEAGNRKPETRNRKPEGGNRKPETGNRKPETGNRKPEAENRKSEAGNRKPETGNQKLETGNRKPETGSWKPKAGNHPRHPRHPPTSS